MSIIFLKTWILIMAWIGDDGDNKLNGAQRLLIDVISIQSK